MRKKLFYAALIMGVVISTNYFLSNGTIDTNNNPELIKLCLNNFLKAPFFYFVMRGLEKKKRSFAYYTIMTLIMQLILVPVTSFDLEKELIKLAALLVGIAVVWVCTRLVRAKQTPLISAQS